MNHKQHRATQAVPAHDPKTFTATRMEGVMDRRDWTLVLGDMALAYLAREGVHLAVALDVEAVKAGRR